MTGHGTTAFAWADGEHTFRLAIGQLRELQEKTGVGPVALFERLRGRTWYVDDLRETIRLGLIGGGMAPPAALGLVKRYVEGRPLLESVEPAIKILMAALVGPPDDPAPQGKAPAGDLAPETPTTSESGSPPSTVPAAPSA